jgi:predicted oxidoreductase
MDSSLERNVVVVATYRTGHPSDSARFSCLRYVRLANNLGNVSTVLIAFNRFANSSSELSNESRSTRTCWRSSSGAMKTGMSPGEVAIAWTLRLPAVTGAIVGARNARQAEGVMRAGELKLTPQDIAEIEGTAAAHAGR